MIINGKVIDIEFDVDVVKKDGSKAVGTTLTYKDNQGKVQSKQWVKKALDHSANAHIKAALQTLDKGTNFEAEAVKNDAGFWNWVGLKIVGEQQTGGNVQPAKSNNYATAEERAQTQLHIIRQSSLGHAVNLLKEKTQDVNEVIRVAKEFEKHVLGIREEQGTEGLINMENDLV